MNSAISTIEVELGSLVVENSDLFKSASCSSLSDQKIKDKIGVLQRRICAPGEFASDLGIRAGLKALKNTDPDSIDFLIFCTQSPDHLIPTTACVMHERLGLRKSAGTIEMNLGCSGWVYAVGIANSLICSQMAKKVLVICADSYSKYMDEMDIPNRSIFGDAGTATILEADNGNRSHPFKVMPFFHFGTDGSGAEFLSVRTSGLKGSPNETPLYMNGMEIYNFCMRKIPGLRDELFKAAQITDHDIGLYVFHQASKTMLDALAHKMKIPDHKMVRSMEMTGNTVSSTIPIALMDVIEGKKAFQGDLIMCLGFGVGLSWAGLILKKY